MPGVIRVLCTSGLQPEEKDEILLGMAKAIFSERPVSSVFLVGLSTAY